MRLNTCDRHEATDMKDKTQLVAWEFGMNSQLPLYARSHPLYNVKVVQPPYYFSTIVYKFLLHDVTKGLS
jgi:hypothetical protein